MKKICFLFVCLVLVGCGSKKTENNPSSGQVEDNTSKSAKLICSKYSEETVNFTTEMTYYYENDEVVNLGIKYVYDLSEYTDTQREVFKNSDMCKMDEIQNTLGMSDCKEELSGTDYIVQGSATKLISQSKGTLNLTKKTLENSGWTCIVQ